MADHPYLSLPTTAFWRSAVAEQQGMPSTDYCTPKWRIAPSDRIATSGSCFAQHIGRYLKAKGFNILDVEPAPYLLPATLRQKHGYEIYSARYGNIYTARQLLQLAEEAFGTRPMSTTVWEADGRYYDALRPTINPGGHATPDAVLFHRRYHLNRVRDLLLSMDILVFTLGLTETWEAVETGQVFPVCPGVIAGTFDPEVYRFRNLTFQETFEDLESLRELLKEQKESGNPRILLTVSPVPLTATASDKHVLLATVYSKSVLRAVAGQICDQHDDMDYFPSYEIVSSPWAPECRYQRNLRSVTDASVALVMHTFMEVHSVATDNAHETSEDGAKSSPEEDIEMGESSEMEMAVICDEELLDSFGRRNK